MSPPPTFFFFYPASHVTVMTKESPDRPDVILPREPRTVVAAAPLVFLGNLTVRHDAPYRLKSVAFFLFEKKEKKRKVSSGDAAPEHPAVTSCR